mmetsp:Transcript_68714/g.217316  ORF Transcript_68714/g.217316 Transcript_68714/m.217316 type:complete len:200 (+) Transcript_68714:266-865(+)
MPTRARSWISRRLSTFLSSSAMSCASWSATASRNSSFEANVESRELPTRPAGTEVKKGTPPRISGSRRRAGGRRKLSTSAPRENWGMRVSNLVETTTVRRSSGSTCMTSFRVVALLQSLVSSRQRMMYSCCIILPLTMASTCLAEVCWGVWRFPGAAEMRPGVSMMVRFGQYLYSILITISLAQNLSTPFSSRRFSPSM